MPQRDPFSVGYRWAKAGLPRTANPYLDNSRSYEYWDAGWTSWHASPRSEPLPPGIQTSRSYAIRRVIAHNRRHSR